MPAPSSTYNSLTDLSLGQIPPEGLDDPAILYQELLDLHNAIEALLTSSDEGAADFTTFIDKFRNNTNISADYTVLITDGTVRVDASAGDVIITLHPVSAGLGYRYDIKRVDEELSTSVTLLGDGTEFIDGKLDGIDIDVLDSIAVKAHDTGWDII